MVGPLRSEQPVLQPVAAEPTNVGVYGPIVDVFTAFLLDACTSRSRLFALWAAAPPAPPSATSAIGDTNERTAIDVRMILLFN